MNDTAFNTTTHSLGGGLWSIEVHDDNGHLLAEFVGENGTRGEADDLWAEFEEWKKI